MIDRLYRASLRALPAPLRAEFGDDMARQFAERLDGVHGHAARARVLGRGVADVFVQAWRERRGAPIDGIRPAALAPHAPRGAGRRFMRNFASDFLHGVRLLRRYPGATLVAVLTLALGIGANTAIFSVVDAVLLKALPFTKPNQLVAIYESRPSEGVMNNVVSPADFLDWRDTATSFAAMSVYEATDVSLATGAEPIRLIAAAVSPGFLDIVGVTPALGRDFTRDDESSPEKARVVLISHPTWRQQFGSDPAIVGKDVTLNGRAWRVIGVLPPSFGFIDKNLAMIIPATFGANPSRGAHFLPVYARLKAGVSVAQAHAEMETIGRQLEAAHPDMNRGHGANVVAMQNAFVRPVKTQLLVLLVAVGLVLLLACVNVGSLMMVQAARRGREMAVRAAIGADRARLMTQSLAESMALAAAGGAAGLALAAALIRVLPVVLPKQLSVVRTDELGLDVRVLAAAAGITMLTSVLFGLWPSIRASRPDPADSLKEGGRGAAQLPRRLRTTIVIAEVALAAMAVVGAGLVLRSFSLITAQPLGFDPSHRQTLTLFAPAVRYPTPEARLQVMTSLENGLGAIPGVSAVGAIDILPLSADDARTGVIIEGREAAPNTPTRMHPRTVTPGYFRAIGMHMVGGRAFTAADGPDALKVSVINQAAAKRWWPGQDPIGKRWAFDGDDKPQWITIVGIVEDVRHWGLSKPVNPMVFRPMAQDITNELAYVVDTTLSSDQLAPAAHDAVRAVDPTLPIGTVQSMEAVVAASLRAERAQTVLMTAFGGMALLLAAIGIYGVMAQLVASRAQEIGLRAALGARPAQLVRLVMLDSAWQTAAGLIAGIGAGVYLIGLGQGLLFGVKPWDPVAIALVSLTLLAAAVAASVVPALRAMKVDPAVALK